MTIGANSNRDELVRTLRGMQFSKLNLGFLKGEDLDGKQREGYDKYGKFQIRFGWGIGAILTGLAAAAMFYAFFPRQRYYHYDDPDFVWIRENFYWLLPIWAVPAYFLWKANRKVEDKESSFLSKAVAKNGLVVLPGGTRFPGDLVNNLNSLLMNKYTSVGTTFESAFALKYDNQIRVAFGLSSLWWDASSSVGTNRGLIPSESLFVYVAVPELTNEFIYVNPSQPPTWIELPAMNDKAKQVLSTLAKRYAVVIGGGGIGVGLAKDSTNGMQSSLRGDMKSPSGWSVCYGLLSEEVADIIEGLE